MLPLLQAVAASVLFEGCVLAAMLSEALLEKNGENEQLLILHASVLVLRAIATVSAVTGATETMLRGVLLTVPVSVAVAEQAVKMSVPALVKPVADAVYRSPTAQG